MAGIRDLSSDAITRVLIVEDDEETRHIVREALTHDGYLCEEARDGMRAMELLRAANPKPDLILLDLMMPRMNGTHMLRHLLEDQTLAHIPVVIMTARPHARAEIPSGTVNGMLRKPFTLEQLQSAVTEALASRTRPMPTSRRPSQADE